MAIIRSAVRGALPTVSFPKIQAAGGEVFTYARVEEIIVENDAVAGVRMKDGHRIDCPCVISSAGIDNTFNTLVPKTLCERFGIPDKLDTVEPSYAHLGVYVGLKKSASDLNLPKTNYWIYPGNDYDGAVERFLADKNAPFPVVYISFPSAKDPDYEQRHPGTSTIEIVAPAPYSWFSQWRDQIWGKRGEDYERFKAEARRPSDGAPV